MRASPEALFAVVADPARRPQWLAELQEVDALPGPATTGTRFTGRSSVLMHDFIGDSEVVRADAPHVLSEQVVIGARLTSTWTFEPVGDAGGAGTRVVHRIEIDYPRGPFAWLETRVLAWRLRRTQRQSLRALARHVLPPPDPN
jgi:uncharacterized protein YndB with AHSA1/START domain